MPIITRIALRSLLAVLLVYSAFPPVGMAADSRPPAGKNNVWYHADDEADTAIVFVHGLASDSRGAWFHEGNGVEDDAYWPELVRRDETFSGSAIFLGGFHTGFDSHHYDFRDAANALHLALKDEIAPASASVLDKSNILFVAHSAGGIVVRDMLIRKTEDFADKAVGLVLIASPSIGTPDADRLNVIADFVRSKQGRELAFNNPYLEGLDKDFKNLVNEDRIPNLVGTEWLEHHLIVSKWFGLYRDSVLVDENTAARYFGESIPIAGSDHISIVKPKGKDQQAHRALRVFYRDDFGNAVARVAEARRALEVAEQGLLETAPSTAEHISDTQPQHPIVRPMTTEQPPIGLGLREAKGPGSSTERHVVLSGKIAGADNVNAAIGADAEAGTRIGTLKDATIPDAGTTTTPSNMENAQVAIVGRLDPVRIDEKRRASLCEDRVEIELQSVWKKSGGRPDNKVTVLSSALADGKAIIEIGNALPLMDGCSPTLVDTGRDSKYFAIFQ